MSSDLLFVPCDGQSMVQPHTRKALNRHVQNSRKGCQHTERIPAPPLPRQIRYRAFTEACQHAPKSRRRRIKANEEVLLRSPDPWALTLPLYRWSDTRGGDLHQYYLTVVARQLFCDKRTRFWDVHVLQTFHELAVVRESLLSLSAAYRHSRLASDRSANSTCIPYMASSHASSCKAVSMLRAYMQHEKDPSHSTVLTCAIILHAQAKFVRDAEAASWHLETAITIMETWAGLQDCDNPTEDFTTLRTALLLLDLEATLESTTRKPRMARAGPATTRFESLDEMMYEQSMVCRDMLTFAMENYGFIVSGPEHCPQSILEDNFSVTRSLQDWKDAADDFVLRRSVARGSENIDMFSADEAEAYASIMLQYYINYCQQATVLAPVATGPSCWDVYTEEILHYGEQILRARRISMLRDSENQTIKNRTLIVNYAQVLQHFVEGTTDPVARAKAMDMVAEAETREQVITAVDVKHLTEGRGLIDVLHSMDHAKT